MKRKKITQLFLIVVFLLGMHNVVKAQSPNPPVTLLDPPTHAASEVLAIYSDAYTVDPSMPILNGTEATEQVILENNVYHVKIGTGNDPCYMEFSSPLDLSAYNTFFIDVYAVEQNPFYFRIRLNGAGSTQQLQLQVKTGWNRLEFDLNDFKLLATVPNLSEVQKINFVGEGARTIYIDNIYACKALHSDLAVIPTSAAPIPNPKASNVLAIFTDVYPNEIGGKLDGQTVGSPATIKGLGYSGSVDKMVFVKNGKTGSGGLNFDSVVDITEYDSLHFDVYPINATFPMRIVIAGVANQGTMVTAGTQNAWNPIDISIDDFLTKVTTMPDITNVKDRGFWLFQATGYERTFFLDNIFFYKTRTEDGPGTGMNTASISDLIKVYPSGGDIMLESKMEMNSIQVYTVSGQNIRTIQQVGTKINIDLQNESNGIYMFKVSLKNGEIITKKILKM